MNIQQYIPHRKPMLLIDEIISVVKNEKIIAKTIFKGNEFFFQGHFPGNPICPGIITLEALGQAAIALITFSFDETKDYHDLIVYIASANDVKFKEIIRPDEEVTYHSTLLRQKEKMYKFHCEAFVRGQLACKGDILLYIGLQ